MANGPIVATRTIEKINEYLERDQGRKYRGILRETMPQAEDAYDDRDDGGFRSHLGASLIGRDCARELWYSFHWATVTRHKGRLLRLFNRGHLEEPRFVALLRMIDCEVWQYASPGKQFRVSHHHGHFGGSLDSVIRGCPDVEPGLPILGEFKTHSTDSFDKLEKSGVRSAKFEHFIQMQTYMRGYSLTAALYMAVNKNNDDIYGEIVPFDVEEADKYHDRAFRIVNVDEPPPKINPSPGWYKCKYCDHAQVCHHNAKPALNCRTCIHSYPTTEARWACGYYDGRILDKAAQLAACSNYYVRKM